MERTSAAGYKENDADVNTVCELTEDARDAVVGYQVSPGLVTTPRAYR